MKRSLGICLVLACAVIAMLPAQAASVNPEGFERYAPTTAWAPNWITDGWSVTSDAPHTTTYEISAAGGANGTQGLTAYAMLSSENAWAYWNNGPSKVIYPTQLWKCDFRFVAYPNTGPADQGMRLYFMPAESTSAAFNAPGIANPEIGLDGTSFFRIFTGAGLVYLDGGTTLVFNQWYSIEMDCDYTTNKVRARFGPTGGTFFNWTDWNDMRNSVQCTVGVLEFNGQIDVDNIEVPGTTPPGDIIGSVIPGEYVGDVNLVPRVVELMQNGSVVSKKNASLDDGTFAFTGLTPGDYEVRLTASTWLRKVVPAAVSSATTTDLGVVTLLAGDIDGDNEVTSTDLSILGLNLGIAGD